MQAAQEAVAAAEYSGSGNLKDALTALSATLDAASRSTGGQSTGGQSAGGQSAGGQSAGDQAAAGETSAGETSAGETSAGQAAASVASDHSDQTGASNQIGQSVTAATLAKDQASIDAARATLIKAAQALSGATIKASSSGTVAQVSVAEGGSVSAGTTAVVVIAPGTTTVELNASSTQVAQLEAGQKVRVTPAGAEQAYAATVTRVSRIPTTSTTGASTYPVTVTLERQRLSLLAGATAAVDVTLGSAEHAVTVPTSAVSSGMVQVYADGRVRRVRVTTGLVGRARTVITDGLEVGQQVVLADLSADLPASDDAGTAGGGSRGFTSDTRRTGFP